eukprot:UN10610
MSAFSLILSIILTLSSGAGVLTISCNNGPCGAGYTTSYIHTPRTANVLDVESSSINKAPKCIINNKKGCIIDSDCCDEKGVCYHGFCLTKSEISFSAQIVSEKVVLDENNDTKNVTMAPLKELIMLIMLLVIVWNTYGLFYCYKKYDKNKHMKAEESDYEADYSTFELSVLPN